MHKNKALKPTVAMHDSNYCVVACKYPTQSEKGGCPQRDLQFADPKCH